MIVCQGTGEEYAIQDQSPSSTTPSPRIGEPEATTLLKMAEMSKPEQTNMNRNTDSLSCNKIDSENGATTASDNIISSTTTKDDEGLGETMSSLTSHGDSSSLTDTLVYTSCSTEDEESSTTPTALSFATASVFNTTTNILSDQCSTENKNTQDNIDNNQQPSSTNQQHQNDRERITQNEKNHDFNTISHATPDHGNDDFGDFHSASTPKHAPFASPAHINTNNENKSNNKSNNLNLNLTTPNDSYGGCSSAASTTSTNVKADPSITSSDNKSDNLKKSTFHQLQRPPSFDHTSKDSGISDMTTSSSIHSTTVDSSAESNSVPSPPDRQDSRSSLSDEARKWLGKHSISSGMSCICLYMSRSVCVSMCV